MKKKEIKQMIIISKTKIQNKPYPGTWHVPACYTSGCLLWVWLPTFWLPDDTHPGRQHVMSRVPPLLHWVAFLAPGFDQAQPWLFVAGICGVNRWIQSLLRPLPPTPSLLLHPDLCVISWFLLTSCLCSICLVLCWPACSFCREGR